MNREFLDILYSNYFLCNNVIFNLQTKYSITEFTSEQHAADLKAQIAHEKALLSNHNHLIDQYLKLHK